MMWNITKDKITERLAVSTDDACNVPCLDPGLNPDNKVPLQLTEATGTRR